MDYLPPFLKRYDLNLQPTNSICIDIESAKDILYPGAHIATSNPYEHYHHGIVIDPNAPDISIIHFWGPDKDHSRVQTTTLPVFLAGSIENLGKRTRHLYLINYDGDTLEKRNETVNIAKELLEKADDVKYDLITKNCESFAHYCRTGTWDTEQIVRLQKFLVENAPEIYEDMKHPDEKNRKHIYQVLQTIPTDDLSPSVKELYDELCQHYDNGSD